MPHPGIQLRAEKPSCPDLFHQGSSKMSCKGVVEDGGREPKASTQERFFLQLHPGVRHATLPVQGESGDGKREKPSLRPAEHWVPPTTEALPGSPDAHLPPAAAGSHPPCCAMPMDAPATALLPGTVCPSLRATQMGSVLALTVRKPTLPAPSLSSAKEGNAPGLLHPPSQPLLPPKATISSLWQFGDVGNNSGVITSLLP